MPLCVRRYLERQKARAERAAADQAEEGGEGAAPAANPATDVVVPEAYAAEVRTVTLHFPTPLILQQLRSLAHGSATKLPIFRVFEYTVHSIRFPWFCT